MTFSLFLFAHWVGDFVFQTNKMAVNKSRSLKWLVVHVLTYTLILAVFSLFLLPVIALEFLLINGVFHLLTDFFTSRLAAKYQVNLRIFYLIIGFDQFIHVATIYWTVEWFIV
ncbi:MAG: DUF3307 domain-containing protein [Bacteroidota bacterium]